MAAAAFADAPDPVRDTGWPERFPAQLSPGLRQPTTSFGLWVATAHCAVVTAGRNGVHLIELADADNRWPDGDAIRHRTSAMVRRPIWRNRRIDRISDPSPDGSWRSAGFWSVPTRSAHFRARLPALPHISRSGLRSEPQLRVSKPCNIVWSICWSWKSKSRAIVVEGGTHPGIGRHRRRCGRANRCYALRRRPRVRCCEDDCSRGRVHAVVRRYRIHLGVSAALRTAPGRNECRLLGTARSSRALLAEVSGW